LRSYSFFFLLYELFLNEFFSFILGGRPVLGRPKLFPKEFIWNSMLVKFVVGIESLLYIKVCISGIFPIKLYEIIPEDEGCCKEDPLLVSSSSFNFLLYSFSRKSTLCYNSSIIFELFRFSSKEPVLIRSTES
jgi:hypothetical protein